MDYNLKYYCDVFADQMDFKDAKQRRNFKAKMKNYADDDYNLSHMLFKLCVKLHKDLENRPDQAVDETKDMSISDKLDHYEKLIQGFPDLYTELRHMREFDDTSSKIGEELGDLEDDDDYGERVDEIYQKWEYAHDEIVETFGVEVIRWDSFFKDKVTHTWIYSPQSYEIYMNNLQVTIKDFPNSQRLAQYKQEILDNIEIKEILQENQ